MTVSVNDEVVNGLQPFPLEGFYSNSLPKFAAPACLSNVEQAPWTNRVPQHEPWPRTMMGDTEGMNDESDEFLRNTSHNPQFVDDGGKASEQIGRVEGDETIIRGDFWRR